jgi:hypothetical protein
MSRPPWPDSHNSLSHDPGTIQCNCCSSCGHGLFDEATQGAVDRGIVICVASPRVTIIGLCDDSYHFGRWRRLGGATRNRLNSPNTANLFKTQQSVRNRFRPRLIPLLPERVGVLFRVSSLYQQRGPTGSRSNQRSRVHSVTAVPKRAMDSSTPVRNRGDVGGTTGAPRRSQRHVETSRP